MKKANFNALQNLPIPDGWVEKALAIPEQEEKAAPIPLWRRKGAIALAASLVLVSVLSVMLFLHTGGKPPITVKPSSTEAVWSTDVNGETTAAIPEATEVKSDPVVSESVSRTPAQSDSDSTEPTIGGTLPSPTASTTSPTEKLSPSQPAPAPTNSPTEPAREEPTKTPQPLPPTESPWEPEYPSEPEWPEETEAPWEAPTEATSLLTTTVSAYLSDAALPTDGRVYCKLVSTRTGKVYGNFGDYDDERLMTRAGRYGGYNVYAYDCEKHFTVPHEYESDECIYYVYDSNGRTLMQDYCYLGAY